MPRQRPFPTLATARVLVLGLLLVLAAHAQRAGASLFIVDTVAVDVGDINPGDNKCEWQTIVPLGQRCTLRAAVEEANAKPGKDTILFPAGFRYEMLVADDLDIWEDVVIGSGVATPDDRPVLDANGLHRMFEVHGVTELTLDAVVITGGAAKLPTNSSTGSGGAILVSNGDASLTLEGVALVGNRAVFYGAALASGGGTLTIRNTEIRDNAGMPGWYPPIVSIVGGSTAVISGSTIADNTSIWANISVDDGSLLVMSNSTIADNLGNGIVLTDSHVALQNVTILSGLYPALANGFNGFGGSTMTVSNSIVSFCDLADTSGLNSGRNLDTNGSCGLDPIIDFPNTDPDLGPLRDNGGWTPTMVPEAGSPVIDQGFQINCPSEDQRGGPRTPGAACELGAVELLPCVESHGWDVYGISIFYTFEFLACYQINVGQGLEVVAGGSPTFRTRGPIIFENDFSVHAGGEMTAINDPTAGSGITLP